MRGKQIPLVRSVVTYMLIVYYNKKPSLLRAHTYTGSHQAPQHYQDVRSDSKKYFPTRLAEPQKPISRRQGLGWRVLPVHH